MNWRSKKYGRITGAQIEQCLNVFRDAWVDRESWAELARNEDKWFASVEKLMAVPNWAPLYQVTLLELLAQIAAVAGISGELVQALKAPDVNAAILDVEVPENPPDHPLAMPLAFAMVGNLEAIARYSHSINDMIVACRGGDLQALFDALSVDSYISTMAFFKSALRIGQLSGDEEAAASIFKSIRGPHKKRLDYPELRWAEYLLRDMGAFEACTREEIYDLIVVHLAIYDPAGSKKDPKAALFTLLRAWQKQAGIQKPRFGFSGKRK